MKRRRRTATPRDQPVFRSALAIFAILLNVIFSSGWSFATAAPDPLKGDYVFCPASGGPMPAAPDRPVPGNTETERLHCAHCRLPVPTAVPVAPPGEASPPNRIAEPLNFAMSQIAVSSPLPERAFEARAPPA